MLKCKCIEHVRMHIPGIKEYVKNLSRKNTKDVIFFNYDQSSFRIIKNHYQAKKKKKKNI